MQNKYDSPFEIGKPVSPENFAGREKISKRIMHYANAATKGNPQ